MGKLLLIVISQLYVLFLHSQRLEEIHAVLLPVGEPLQISPRRAEELQLHLLELPRPEDEIARRYLVSEGFTHLSDAEGDLFPGSTLHIFKIHEYALSSFRSQENLRLGILGNALERLEHQIELPDSREIALAAFRAFYPLLFYEGLQLFIGPAVYGDIVHPVFLEPAFDELVGSESGLTALTVYQRVCKTSHVP